MKFAILIFSLWSCAGIQAQFDWTVYDTGNSDIPYDWVTALTTDSTGGIWVGTEFGLAYMKDDVWTSYYSSPGGLPDDVIRSLAIDSSGLLWVGTFMGGLASFDGSVWTVYNQINSPLPENFVRALHVDADNKLLIGTTAGLAILDDTIWTVYSTDNSSLPGNNITSIWTMPDGTIWVGTINTGLARFDGKGWISYTILNSDLMDNTQLDLVADSDGNLWMATPAHGLAVRSASGNFLHFQLDNSNIPDNDCAQVELDENDDVLLGMAAVGLALYDGESWTSWDSSNSGMSDNYIRALTTDNQFNVWMGTENGGLIKRSPADTTSGLGHDFQMGNLTLFPNPSSSSVFIIYDSNPHAKTEIKLFDLQGSLRFYTHYKGSSMQIDLNELESGMYRAVLFSDNIPFASSSLVIIR